MPSRSYQEPCESFFTEEAQIAGLSSTMNEVDDRVDIITDEERQLIIAENLSTELVFEYGADVVLHMTRMEVS